MTEAQWGWEGWLHLCGLNYRQRELELAVKCFEKAGKDEDSLFYLHHIQNAPEKTILEVFEDVEDPRAYFVCAAQSSDRHNGYLNKIVLLRGSRSFAGILKRDFEGVSYSKMSDEELQDIYDLDPVGIVIQNVALAFIQQERHYEQSERNRRLALRFLRRGCELQWVQSYVEWTRCSAEGFLGLKTDEVSLLFFSLFCVHMLFAC
jgi:hypothetical protein